MAHLVAADVLRVVLDRNRVFAHDLDVDLSRDSRTKHLDKLTDAGMLDRVHGGKGALAIWEPAGPLEELLDGDGEDDDD